jgi:hypothetical protein
MIKKTIMFFFPNWFYNSGHSEAKTLAQECCPRVQFVSHTGWMYVKKKIRFGCDSCEFVTIADSLKAV